MALLPRTYLQRKRIKDAAASGMAIAELEYVGLNLRIINALEESVYGIVYLRDLICLKEAQILEEIPQIGEKGLGLIKQALRQVHEIENRRKQWYKASDRLDFYKQNIPNTVLT